MKQLVKIAMVVALIVSYSAPSVYSQEKKAAKTEKKAKLPKKQEVTFNVSMDCHSCQQKIEKNIPWEKGVKDLKVDLENKTVKVGYDPRKTNEDNLKQAFEKLDFKCEKQ